MVVIPAERAELEPNKTMFVRYDKPAKETDDRASSGWK